MSKDQEVRKVDVKATFKDALGRMFSEEQLANMPKQEYKERERMYMAGMGTAIAVLTADHEDLTEDEHGEMMYAFFGSVEEYWATEAGL